MKVIEIKATKNENVINRKSENVKSYQNKSIKNLKLPKEKQK